MGINCSFCFFVKQKYIFLLDVNFKDTISVSLSKYKDDKNKQKIELENSEVGDEIIVA